MHRFGLQNLFCEMMARDMIRVGCSFTLAISFAEYSQL